MESKSWLQRGRRVCRKTERERVDGAKVKEKEEKAEGGAEV